MSYADQLDVFYGRVTHSSAQVYVRVSSLVGGDEWSIAGHVRGPIAREARTLPITVMLTDMGVGATLLASCAIPDPAFWTTQLPGVYEVHIDLRRNGEVVETITRSIGLRFFGASGRKFLWEGKRWVVRGVELQVEDDPELDVFRDNAGVFVVKEPSESLLSGASNTGVLLVVELAGLDVLQELRSLSRWPAVAVGILPTDCDVTKALRAAAPNLLLAQRIEAGMAIEVADWAQLVICDASNVEAIGEATASSPLPIVAHRRLNGDFTLVEARQECDRLQSDLVSLGDFAGYVVQI